MKHIAEFLKQVNHENAFKHKLRAYTTEKVSVFGVILVRIFPSFFRIRIETERYGGQSEFSPNVGKYGKNADQNNSEYGHFIRRSIVVAISRVLDNALHICFPKQEKCDCCSHHYCRLCVEILFSFSVLFY